MSFTALCGPPNHGRVRGDDDDHHDGAPHVGFDHVHDDDDDLHVDDMNVHGGGDDASDHVLPKLPPTA